MDKQYAKGNLPTIKRRCIVARLATGQVCSKDLQAIGNFVNVKKISTKRVNEPI